MGLEFRLGCWAKRINGLLDGKWSQAELNGDNYIVNRDKTRPNSTELAHKFCVCLVYKYLSVSEVPSPVIPNLIGNLCLVP